MPTTPRIIFPISCLVLLLSLWSQTAAAQTVTTRQVGPQTFHQRIEIPNAVGSQTKFNNPDTFNGNTYDRNKHLQRNNDRRSNKNRNNIATDSRTQSENVDTKRRQTRMNNATRTQMQRGQRIETTQNGLNN